MSGEAAVEVSRLDAGEGGEVVAHGAVGRIDDDGSQSGNEVSAEEVTLAGGDNDVAGGVARGVEDLEVSEPVEIGEREGARGGESAPEVGDGLGVGEDGLFEA